MIAVVFTEGATSPGIQERSELITDSGYLMPGRLPTLAMSGIWTARIFLLGGLRRHGAPLILARVICGMVSTSCRRKSICEPCIRPAIMMVKPTPMDTPAMPTRVCRTRELTWSHAMLNRSFTDGYRLLLMKLRRASLTTESMWAVMAAEITASSGSEDAVVTEATTAASGVAPG